MQSSASFGVSTSCRNRECKPKYVLIYQGNKSAILLGVKWEDTQQQLKEAHQVKVLCIKYNVAHDNTIKNTTAYMYM